MEHSKLYYTLIIPHYNIPNLLRRLLSTVPKREDLQVIVVDDCSSKDIDVFEKVKENYCWVEYYSTDVNGGGGKARNIGMKYAKGKYLIFADADDYFTPAFYDILDDYKMSDADMIFCNAMSVDSNTYEMSDRNDYLNYLIKLNKKNPTKAVRKLKYTFGEPWCKFVKRCIVEYNKISFQETSCYNDTYFSYMVGYFANDIKVDSRIMYVVTFRDDSVINTIISAREYLFCEICVNKESFLIEKGVPEHCYGIYDLLITRMIKCDFGVSKELYFKLVSRISATKVNKVIFKRLFARLLFKVLRNNYSVLYSC